MQSATLKEVMQEKGQAPHNTKSLKVAVVSADNARTYKNEKGQEKKVLNASIADASQAVKCVIYDDTKFSKFQEGKSLIIKNSIRKPESIIITSTTKVYPTTKVEISDAIRQAAVSLLKPPQADRKPLNEALKSPVKTRVSIMGQLIQEEATQEVEVKSDRVQVKTIYIKDQTVPRCKVSLWRELTSVDVRPGDHICISDVVLNVFRGEASFSTTSLTKIQKCEAPEEERVVNIIGCSVQDVDVIFLLEDETELVVGLELVKQVFPTDEDLEYHILNLCEDGLSINATIKGSDVIRMTKV